MKRTSRRIRALLLAAAMMLTLFPMTPALTASGTITENGTYNLSAYGTEGIITINPGLTVTLEGSADATYVYTQIDCGASVNLTLNNVNINNNYIDVCALSFTGAGNTLTLVGENTLRSGRTQPGVKVEGSTELTIQGAGSLTATGGGTTGLNGAGIGGGANMNGGKITINSGRLTATGGRSGAGIGGGARGNGGTFIINGGTVTATGGQYGAGIGGGCYDSGGAVTINGGSVRATGTGGRKDIGGGAGATDHGTLKNGDGDGVYLTPIQLLGGGANNAAVSSLTTDLAGYSYGLKDVFSDSLGWLYFYLPVGTTTTGVFTPAGIFTGCAITAASPTTFYTNSKH